MNCFLPATDCAPSPLPTSISTLCPDFSFEFPALERDYMGIAHAKTPARPLIHPTSSSFADPSPPAADLHLKLAPPSSGRCDVDDADADEGEPLSVNIGWPPISSYRKSTTKALISVKPPCSIETTTPLIVHEAPLDDHEELPPIIKSNVVVDDDDDDKHEASPILHINVLKAPLRKPLHIKVSMDGTPIMRKLDLHTMQGYHHLSLELHKLFKFYKRNLSCEVGEHSCFKDLNGATFILTYKDRDGDWMLAGDTAWETFVESARRIRIMKKAK